MTRRDLDLSCRCGAFGGTLVGVRPLGVSRVACHCGYCRRYLDDMACPEGADALGGSRVFQVSPAKVRFDRGLEHLVAGSYTKKGAVRWYTSCCDTPIANSVRTGTAPFIGIYEHTLPADTRDTALGPLLVRLNGPYPSVSQGRVKGAPWHLASMMLRLTALMAVWWLRGDAARSPLFEGPERQPIRPIGRLADRTPPAPEDGA